MRKYAILLMISLFILGIQTTYAIKVVFKAKPISTNLIKGPYAVFVYYKIYDDSVTSNIDGLIDMPLLKKKDIKNIVVKKSDKLIIGQKPKFKKIKEGRDELGLIATLGFKDYDIVQGNTYAYMLYFNSNENESNNSGLKKSGPNNVKVDSASITLTNLSIDYENDSPKISNYLEPPGEGGGGGGGTTTTTTISLGNPDIAFAKLNNVFREAGHNPFQQNIISLSEGGFLQALSYTRVVELDLHKTHNSSNGWDVYHTFANDHNCGGGGSSFDLCLDDLESFHIEYPDHDPIMVFLDLKTYWESFENRTTTHLDNLLTGIFGNNIYKPSDFQGSNSDMRLLAQKNNWPSFEDLLGKIIFILGAESDELNQYQLERGNSAVCFTMAGTYQATINEKPKIQHLTYMDYDYPDKFIFYNFQLQDSNQSDWNLAPAQTTAPSWTSDQGFFTRVWSHNGFPSYSPGNYNEADFTSVKNNRINAIATRNIDEERSYEDDGIYNYLKLRSPDLSGNHIYTSYPITQYGKNSIVTGTLIVEPNTNYRLVSGGPITLSPATDFKPGSNVEILEYQTLTSTLKYDILRSQMLTKEEIEEIMKEVNSELYNYQAVEDLERFDFLVYPSPASAILNFVYLNETGEDIVVQIYNISGQKVIQMPYSGQYIGQQKNTINISSLNNGIYIIKLIVNNTILTNKFVKQ